MTNEQDLRPWLTSVLQLDLGLEWLRRKTFEEQQSKASALSNSQNLWASRERAPQNETRYLANKYTGIYRSDGTNLRMSVVRDHTQDSRVQIVAVIDPNPPVRLTLSDGMLSINAIVPRKINEGFSLRYSRGDHKSITDHTRNGVISIPKFEVLATHLGPEDRKIQLYLEAIDWCGKPFGPHPVISRKFVMDLSKAKSFIEELTRFREQDKEDIDGEMSGSATDDDSVAAQSDQEVNPPGESTIVTQSRKLSQQEFASQIPFSATLDVCGQPASSPHTDALLGALPTRPSPTKIDSRDAILGFLNRSKTVLEPIPTPSPLAHRHQDSASSLTQLKGRGIKDQGSVLEGANRKSDEATFGEPLSPPLEVHKSPVASKSEPSIALSLPSSKYPIATSESILSQEPGPHDRLKENENSNISTRINIPMKRGHSFSAVHGLPHWLPCSIPQAIATIPKDQRVLLSHPSSWLPPPVGQHFPPGNLPRNILDQITRDREREIRALDALSKASSPTCHTQCDPATQPEQFLIIEPRDKSLDQPSPPSESGSAQDSDALSWALSEPFTQSPHEENQDMLPPDSPDSVHVGTRHSTPHLMPHSAKIVENSRDETSIVDQKHQLSASYPLNHTVQKHSQQEGRGFNTTETPCIPSSPPLLAAGDHEENVQGYDGDEDDDLELDVPHAVDENSKVWIAKVIREALPKLSSIQVEETPHVKNVKKIVDHETSDSHIMALDSDSHPQTSSASHITSTYHAEKTVTRPPGQAYHTKENSLDESAVQAITIADEDSMDTSSDLSQPRNEEVISEPPEADVCIEDTLDNLCSEQVMSPHPRQAEISSEVQIQSRTVEPVTRIMNEDISRLSHVKPHRRLKVSFDLFSRDVEDKESEDPAMCALRRRQQFMADRKASKETSRDGVHGVGSRTSALAKASEQPSTLKDPFMPLGPTAESVDITPSQRTTKARKFSSDSGTIPDSVQKRASSPRTAPTPLIVSSQAQHQSPAFKHSSATDSSSSKSQPDFNHSVYHRFRQVYPAYNGTLYTFVDTCELIRNLRVRGKWNEEWFVDDFIIRKALDYQSYYAECREQQRLPSAYDRYYRDLPMGRDCPFDRNIITESVLEEILDGEMEEPASRDTGERRVSAGHDTANDRGKKPQRALVAPPNKNSSSTSSGWTPYVKAKGKERLPWFLKEKTVYKEFVEKYTSLKSVNGTLGRYNEDTDKLELPTEGDRRTRDVTSWNAVWESDN